MSGLCFTACSDDDDEERTYSTTPEIASAGVYEGTWTKIQDGGDTTYAKGTLKFEPYTVVTTDTETGETSTVAQPYATMVTAACNDNGISIDKASVANITYAGDDYRYNNMRGASNGFGANFSGTITAGGVATVSYSLTEKSGRKTYVFYYSFEGTKKATEE